jgi:hypothetical protein
MPPVLRRRFDATVDHFGQSRKKSFRLVEPLRRRTLVLPQRLFVHDGQKWLDERVSIVNMI